MPRPFKFRRIRGNPNANFFKPAGIPKTELEETVLSMDEFEAMRLIHVEGISQEEAASKMEVSQPTFSRILNSAMKKIADAIVNGKAIHILDGKGPVF